VELSALTAALAVEEMETQWARALKSPRSKGMETSAEACWRLSKACGQWAVESRDSAARTAFRQMATEWARLAFNEEFISPVGERIDPPSSESFPRLPQSKSRLPLF
jgi:hypothetical protein